MSSMEARVDEALGRRLRLGLSAGARGFVILTGEEGRALATVERVGDALEWTLRTWSSAAGIDLSGRELELEPLLRRLRGQADRDGELWLLFDALAAARGHGELRLLRELAQRHTGPAVILVERQPGPVADLPELIVEHLALPKVEELSAHTRALAGDLAQDRPELARTLEQRAQLLARIGVGLELERYDRLLAEAIVGGGETAEEMAEHLARRKPATLLAGGLLETLAAVPVAELGGLERYLGWLRRRALALEPGARQAGIPHPRGALLVGVQGCGKSLAARASADLLGLALVRLDLGRMFGGTVGESEANLRQSTKIIERMAPVVVWIDEIDKGLAGAEASRSDAGTAARVLGTLLTWLQERDQPVFVIATANRVDGLPPELLRRGRLDELFFVDLPTAEQRAAILAIHLLDKPARELGVAPALADAPEAFLALARAAEGFSGSELEAALIEARLDAFARGEPLAARDLERALAETVPLSRSRAEEIAALREWADTRARRA